MSLQQVEEMPRPSSWHQERLKVLIEIQKILARRWAQLSDLQPLSDEQAFPLWSQKYSEDFRPIFDQEAKELMKKFHAGFSAADLSELQHRLDEIVAQKLH